MAREVIKSDCIMCINSCGIEATVEDGKLVKVEGMKEHPISEGVLCPRGEALRVGLFTRQTSIPDEKGRYRLEEDLLG